MFKIYVYNMYVFNFLIYLDSIMDILKLIAVFIPKSLLIEGIHPLRNPFNSSPKTKTRISNAQMDKSEVLNLINDVRNKNRKTILRN